jgi:outer membrane protein W
MKKFFTSALLIAGLTVHKANAQQGFSLSAKAIPQFSFLQNKDDNNNNNYSTKATFNAGFGVGAEYGFNNHVGVGIDVLYSLQGQRYTLNDIEYNQKVNYIKVPVYFIYNSDASKPISFIGKIGPQVSFMTDANLSNKNGDKIQINNKNRYQSVTFGGVAEAGAQYKIARQMYLTTLARFDYDFTNAEDDTFSGYSPGRAKTYNSTIGLEVGLKYMIN